MVRVAIDECEEYSSRNRAVSARGAVVVVPPAAREIVPASRRSVRPAAPWLSRGSSGRRRSAGRSCIVPTCVPATFRMLVGTFRYMENDIALWVQSAAVLVAVGASLVALSTSYLDRRNNRRIAAETRAADIRVRSLLLELEHAIRLATNRNMGGSSDGRESNRLGAEATALVTLLGKERVPVQWENLVGHGPEELLGKMDEPETPDWVKHKIETGIAVQRILTEFRSTSGV